ncbi:MAG: cell division protein SepF [Oscillospiraceae bacterium]|nr:cell division protein SepF [Oscillospiraceae bacterium]
MSFFEELKKLTKPYDEDEEDYEDEIAEQPVRQRSRSGVFSSFGGETEENRTSKPQQSAKSARPKEGKVVSLGGDQNMQVVLIKPERFETAAEAADHLRDNRAVLLNLESTPRDVVRRLVDFLSGVTYAINGNIRRVASNTYIITPPNVNLVGDQLEELENGGMYY